MTESVPIYISNDKLAAFGENTARRMNITGEISAKRVMRKVLGDLSTIRREHGAMASRYGQAGELPRAAEWLLDNHYLAQREGKNAAADIGAARRLRAVAEGALLTEACGALVRSGNGEVTAERTELFISGFQKVYPLSRIELSLLASGIRAELISRLAELLRIPEPDSDALAAVFGSLRLFSSLDLTELLERVDLVGQLFYSDPAGVYPLMDEESRDHYRRELTILAKRSGQDELSLARSLLQMAEGADLGARHIGYWLFTKPMGGEKRARRGGAYIAANILLTLFFTLLAGFAVNSAAAGFLLLLPVSELVKNLLDFFILRTVSPRFIPRLELREGVPEEGRTVCVISALLTDENSGPAMAACLERFSILSRPCGENLVFGILADLPEAGEKILPGDAAAIEAAKRAVDGLNDKYGGGFYLFCRRRTLSGKEGRWFGKERKRGALLSLARLVSGEATELSVVSGDARGLMNSKFILTLDSDTLLSPNSARELVGAMLHPMNRPVVDEARGIVTAGFGLIHPRIGVELASAVKSGFSRIFAGQGGTDPYGSACGEVYMDLFGHGGFSGKGIIDVAALLRCTAQLPTGRILSHDAVEGAFLRGGYMSDVELTDGFPASPLSYYRRMHRWTRGDWQNGVFLFRRGRALTDSDKWRFFDNLRRSLVSPLTFLAIFLGLILPKPGLIVAAFAALLCMASQLMLSLAESALRPVEELRTRYHSTVIHGAVGVLIQTALRLMLLPFEAWVSISAIVTALWRMLVSHENLLSWQTAAQTDGAKSTIGAYFKSMWTPLLAAAGLFILGHPSGWAVGIVWLLSPLVAWALGKPQEKSGDVSDADRRYLTERAAEFWSYFETFCTERDNFLPPDNWQERPPVGLAHRSSPTNIGLALVSALAALDLGVSSKEKVFTIIEGILGTLERLPKWHGHPLNWYDTRTLKPLAPEYVSTVDSGNFAACLLVLRAGASEYGREDIAARADAIYEGMDFAPLFDNSRRLFYIGYDLSAGHATEGWYDLMSSEARLTGYLAIARGDVPPKHWRQLSRALVQKDGYRGMASWTGTMFEYLMPELFLPLCPESLLWESAKFALYVQKKRVSGRMPWGISESAFFSLDPSLSYRYKAHGCAGLALKRGMDDELVVSPYSTFLALAVDPDDAVENLHRLEKFGMLGRFGFWEALDFTPSRCRFKSGETVRCVMSHHLGMSIASVANFLCNGVMRRRFMAEPAMAAYHGFLEEKVPIGSPVLRRRSAEPPEKPSRGEAPTWEKRGGDIDRARPECCLLSNGVYSLMLTESGMSTAHAGGMGIYTAPEDPLTGPVGLRLYLERDDERLGLLPCEDESGALNFSWQFSSGSALISAEGRGLVSRCSAAISARDAAEARFIEIEAEEALSGALCLSFEPTLAYTKDRAGHPAFWRLGLYAEAREGALLIRRLARGKMPGSWLCLACDVPMTFSANDGGEPLGWLSEPMVRAKAPFDIPAGGAFAARFALALGASADDAFAAAQRTLSMGPADFADLPAAAAALYGLDSREGSAAMSMLSALAFPRLQGEVTEGRDSLWRFGISGDEPIICAYMSSDEERREAPALVRKHALLSICGFKSDLVFLSGQGGDYLQSESRAVSDTLAKLGLESALGAPGGVHVVDAAEGEQTVVANSALVFRSGQGERVRSTANYPAPPEFRAGGEPAYAWLPDGSFEFTVTEALPRRVWSNMLSNRRFGFTAADSGCGSMWYKNAREGRINRWKNEPRGVIGDETLAMATGTGRISLFGAEDGIARKITFGFGFARWETGGTRVTAFVPPDTDARVLIIENSAGDIYWQTGLVLAGDDMDAAAVVTRASGQVLYARNARAGDPDLDFTTVFSSEPLGFTCDEASWLRGELDGKCGAGLRPCFGAALRGGTQVIVCGADSEEKLRALANLDAAMAAYERTLNFWNGLAGRLRIKTPDAALNRYMNGWAAYQVAAGRLFGRTSIYQSGGAFGFRDQLQDAVNLIMVSPVFARERILDSCNHQYLEGDVMHWWHQNPAGDKGVRTRCSDDLLWLPWALCEYIEKTGDAEVLEESTPYLTSAVLNEDEKSRYETAVRSEERGTVMEHAERALKLVMERGVGEHGLLLMGDGDWNDGMDAVGEKGRGESVWLTWFFANTVRRFSVLMEKRGNKPAAAAALSAAMRMGRAADRAWDGGWYLRGYFDDGAPLGSHESRGCRIDSIAQSWGVFCAESSPEKRRQALDSALTGLYDRSGGVVKLFWPPFGDGTEDAGYIKSYGPGFRENGGQYTHGAIWLAAACFREGRPNDGAALLHTLCSHEGYHYGAEPFVISADVYANPDRYGEAGWSWYTGSAGWFFRVTCEELLGLRLEDGRLTVSPHLPEGWEGFEAIWKEPSGVEHRVSVRGDITEIDGVINK